jgi:hypothetical protein
MTRRPRKAKTARKVLRKMPHKGRKVAKSAKPKRDPLDDFIAAGARALDLKIEKGWMPAVRGNLQLILRLGALVTAFALPDDAEPAPVFKA